MRMKPVDMPSPDDLAHMRELSLREQIDRLRRELAEARGLLREARRGAEVRRGHAIANGLGPNDAGLLERIDAFLTAAETRNAE